jgi:hypothetical protein
MAALQLSNGPTAPPTSIDQFIASLGLSQTIAQEVKNELISDNLASWLSSTQAESDNTKRSNITCTIAQIVFGPETLRNKNQVQPVIQESWLVFSEKRHVDSLLTEQYPGHRRSGKFRHAWCAPRPRRKFRKSCVLSHSSNVNLPFVAEDTLLIRELRAYQMVC